MSKNKKIVMCAVVIGIVGYLFGQKYLFTKENIVKAHQTMDSLQPRQSMSITKKNDINSGQEELVDENQKAPLERSIPASSLNNQDDPFDNINNLSAKEEHYREALHRFHSALKDISTASLRKEQEHLNKMAELSRTVTIKQPFESIFTDRFGNRWIKRVFDDQIIRYDFLPSV